MTRTVKIVGLIVALVLTFGGPALSVAPAWAEGNAIESEVVALKQEVASIEAQLQKLESRDGSTSRGTEVPATPECIHEPEALMVDEAAQGLCS